MKGPRNICGWILTALIGLLGLGASAASAQSSYAYLTPYLKVDGDVGLVKRDGLLAFNRTFGLDAVALLDAGKPDDYQIAVALVAIGASGLLEELGRLEAIAKAGTPLARRAAILALGEAGPQGGRALMELASDPELGQLATVALLRSDYAEGRKMLLERFKASGANPKLLGMIDFIDAPGNFTEMPAVARLLYQLRFDAARSFGLVDGQRWGVHLSAALAEDEDFLDHVVFLSAAESYDASVRDFVLERLVDKGGSAPILAAMRSMPTEFRALMDAELFMPANVVEWELIVSEIKRKGVVLEDAPILSRAKHHAAVELEAHSLLSELGDQTAQEALRDLLASERAQVRAAAATGLGGSRDKQWLIELERMQDDPDGRVQAAALVGRARLGSGVALAAIREVLRAIEPTEQRSHLVIAMATLRRDSTCEPLLRLARETAVGPERLTIDLSLRLRGDMLLGRELNAVLAQPSGLDGREWIVLALAKDYDRQDLSFFGSVFPSERHPSLNIDLAVALARGAAREGKALLRKALWKGPFDRSQLAAAALVHHGGLKALTAELESVPVGATPDALRRVGYAMGVFGGLTELERLRRWRGPADPALQGAYLGALASRTH